MVKVIGYITQLQRIIIFCLVISLLFPTIPRSSFTALLGTDLSIYFLVMALISLIYEHVYIKNKVVVPKFLVIFIILYNVWQIICLIYGLWAYAYPEYMTISRVTNNPIYINILCLIQTKFPFDDELLIAKLFYFFKAFRGIICSNNIIFSVFFFWHVYKNNFQQAYSDVRKAIICLIVFMGSYSFIELLWVKLRIEAAKDFLITVNPYLYDIAVGYGWYPPLLWNGGVRSMCTESSHFGIMAALCFPFLWSYFFYGRRWYHVLLAIYFSLMVAATFPGSRTAYLLLTIEIFCLLIWSFYMKNRKIFITALMILSCVVSGFIVDNIYTQFSYYIMRDVQSKNQPNQNQIIPPKLVNNVYISSLATLSNKKARSNPTRFNAMKRGLELVLEHPICGVGYNLHPAYFLMGFKPEQVTSEIRLWINSLKQGKQVSATMGASYLSIASQNGIIGLIFYLTLPVWLIIHLMRKKEIIGDYRVFSVIIIMIALFAAQFSTPNMAFLQMVPWGLLLLALEYEYYPNIS